MLGMLITLAFCVGMVGIGRFLLGKLLTGFDPAAALGLSGMVALAAVGTETLLIGLIPGGLQWGLYVEFAVALLGIGLLLADRSVVRFSKPAGFEWAFVATIAICGLIALVSVLAPSDMSDWDTLSHHLAAPKIWIGEGKITLIPFMHQSNFPFAVDNLYIWGLQWGGQAGAKAFMFAFYMLGIATVFGLSRKLYGRTAAWWSALMFATIPVVLWESGTAYIDVAHGLFAGLGILFAGLYIGATPPSHQVKGDSGPPPPPPSGNYLWLSAFCLGFAAGTKYTGLQTIIAVCAVLVLFGVIRRRPFGFQSAVIIGIVALAIASPWYIKNQVWNSNPVYPFFHSVFKGKNWDDKRSAIYQNEQRTFGVGRDQMAGPPKPSIDPMQIGHAVLGIAYQPGRFTNPGQTQGFGDPMSAIGVPVIAVIILLLIRGRPKPHEAFVLGSIGISLVMWFVLSQQSRYLTSIAPPLAIISGGLVTWPSVGALLRVAIALQALWTIWLFKFAPQGAESRFDAQLRVVTGKVSGHEFLARRLPFSEPAKVINDVAKGGKVALYDEVFGFLLDVPYFWANPGHSTMLADEMVDWPAAWFVDVLRLHRFTHIYVAGRDPTQFPFMPIPTEQHKAIKSNWEISWKAMISDAALDPGQLEPLQTWPGRGVLYRITYDGPAGSTRDTDWLRRPGAD